MDFGILAFFGLFVTTVLLAWLGTMVSGLRDIVKDYTHKTNLLLAESRVEVPPERLVNIWREKYAEAPEGSAKKIAYKNKLDEFYLLRDGDRYQG